MPENIHVYWGRLQFQKDEDGEIYFNICANLDHSSESKIIVETKIITDNEITRIIFKAPVEQKELLTYMINNNLESNSIEFNVGISISFLSYNCIEKSYKQFIGKVRFYSDGNYGVSTGYFDELVQPEEYNTDEIGLTVIY